MNSWVSSFVYGESLIHLLFFDKYDRCQKILYIRQELSTFSFYNTFSLFFVPFTHFMLKSFYFYSLFFTLALSNGDKGTLLRSVNSIGRGDTI